jgi:hypothetical protein
MTDLEKFKQLFDTCSIWRGGGSLSPNEAGDGSVAYSFNIAVDHIDERTHKTYVQLVAYFDAKGNWTRTVEATKTSINWRKNR